MMYAIPTLSLNCTPPPPIFHATDGSVEINGVTLPAHVAEELRRIGMPLAWYNRGELADAIEHCSYDRTLIDDEHGVHFRDQLHLDSDERIRKHRHRRKLTVTAPEQPCKESFCERLDAEDQHTYCQQQVNN